MAGHPLFRGLPLNFHRGSAPVSSAQISEALDGKAEVHIAIADLDRQLLRLKRRARLLRHGTEQNADHWAVWSGAMDEALALVEHITRTPARDAADLAIKISATVWFLETTDAVVDVGGLRQLRIIVKYARRLVRGVSRGRSTRPQRGSHTPCANSSPASTNSAEAGAAARVVDR